MHADRINRVMLTLFGLLVLAAGAAAMAASTGVFGAAFSRQALLANRVSAYFGNHGGWLWPAIAGGCVLIALACLRWMLALLASTDRAGDLIGHSTHEGTTILRPTALVDALTREVGAYHGVETAQGPRHRRRPGPRGSSHRRHGPVSRPAGPASPHRSRGLRPRPARPGQPLHAHPARPHLADPPPVGP